MADYSGYEPRTFDDDLADLQTLQDVIQAYRTLAYAGEIRRSPESSTRSDYALKRLRETFRHLKELKANRY